MSAAAALADALYTEAGVSGPTHPLALARAIVGPSHVVWDVLAMDLGSVDTWRSKRPRIRLLPGLWSAPSLLAHVVAHELGHVLLMRRAPRLHYTEEERLCDELAYELCRRVGIKRATIQARRRAWFARMDAPAGERGAA